MWRPLWVAGNDWSELPKALQLAASMVTWVDDEGWAKDMPFSRGESTECWPMASPRFSVGSINDDVWNLRKHR